MVIELELPEWKEIIKVIYSSFFFNEALALLLCYIAEPLESCRHMFQIKSHSQWSLLVGAISFL